MKKAAGNMTLTGVKKHVGVLEQAVLVTTEKVGRVRTCRIGPRRLEEETAWIEQRAGAHRVRGVDQARAVQAVVGAEVDGHVPA
jgi:hypothetical protein